ncbi:MAG: hypothetical protein LBB08_01195 [Rickettsiales bacterium]|nr:hypothetical protein [Rickettsiales bacterium]
MRKFILLFLCFPAYAASGLYAFELEKVIDGNARAYHCLYRRYRRPDASSQKKYQNQQHRYSPFYL